MQKHLEQKVTETAAVVTDWKNSIASIETQFNTANLALMRAKKEREIHALKAAMGDAGAIAAIKAARDAQRDAESTIEDLKVIALPAAEEQLAAAERAATAAGRQLAKFEAEVLMKQRVEVAAQLDKVIADFASLYARYAELGTQIVSMDVLPRTVHGTSDYESAIGARRVRASLPAFFWKLFPGAIHDEMKTENLATSESRFWNLPPEHDEKSKAA